MENKGFEKLEAKENKAVVKMLIASTKKDKWITGAQIADELKNAINSPVDYTDATVRPIIKRLRRKNMPIIASGKGYKITTDSTEIAEQAASLRGRANDLLMTARALDALALKLYDKQRESRDKQK